MNNQLLILHPLLARFKTVLNLAEKKGAIYLNSP
jgi:hypothetical protein